MIKIHVFLKQHNGDFRMVHKQIELPIVPPPDSYFSYQEGWGMSCVNGARLDNGVYLEVTSSGISLSGYGPQFTPKEIEELISLGWTAA